MANLMIRKDPGFIPALPAVVEKLSGLTVDATSLHAVMHSALDLYIAPHAQVSSDFWDAAELDLRLQLYS